MIRKPLESVTGFATGKGDVQEARSKIVIHFTKADVAAGRHEELSPERFDFVWNDDYTECTAHRLAWYDDRSYAAYQSGNFEDGE